MADGHGSFHRIAAGNIEVWALADATLDLPLALFPDAALPGADASFGPGPFPTAVTCFAIRRNGRLALIDAGCGTWRGPYSGQLLASMRAAGLDPEAVDTILMTHLHSDHAGGLLAETGTAFPRVELAMARAEAAYWSDPDLPARIPERMRNALATAGKALAAYEGRIRLFDAGDEVLPGVTAVALPGHTPGQTGFRIGSDPDGLFVWADVVHVAPVQFAHPDWTIAFDTDGREAAKTRLRVFAECAEAGTRVAGMHLPFPSIGRIVRDGGAYAWRPDA